MLIVNNKDPKTKNHIRFVCMSDTHGKTKIEVPDGDILIHAGDLTVCGSKTHFYNTIAWLSSLPHKIKIITAGNHDTYLDSRFGYDEVRKEMLDSVKKHGLIYLEHEKYEIPEWGFTLFVSPFAPLHFEGAFMLEDLSTIWDDIDDTVDILVTHTPPQGYLDTIRYKNRSVGCGYLRDRIDHVIHPKVHIFGHIHEAYGYMTNEEGQLFVNASLCDRGYTPNHKPITFDIPKLLQKTKKIKK